MAQIDYKLLYFYKAILQLFLASGALPLNPPPGGGGLPKVAATPLDLPCSEYFTGSVAASISNWGPMWRYLWI